MRLRAAIPVIATAVALASGGTAWAFQQLTPGVQVNNDPAAGIDPAQSVAADDPANADVVGGALTAGKVAVPWAIFRQTETGQHDQIFSRSFAAGVWTTRGSGTVGGRSSATPTFSGSLNFDQGQDGEAPSIDFAGAGRTVPWATWYEDTSGAGFTNDNIFASRFDNAGDANQGEWIFGGQGRGLSGGTIPVPSLNLHTDQDAENPSVAGGATTAGNNPGPWVTWQETSTVGTHPDQIFVSRPEGPGMANCDGVTPAGTADITGHVPAIGGFCWQQTGVPRFGTGTPDPSLNVDPSRNGVEPDIAFTGAGDVVPWAVWYEKDASTLGLHSNEMVFAAKAISDGVAANGGFHWVVVGNQAPQQELDTTGATNHLGGCAESSSAEAACSLNTDANADAEDPRIAGGTMTAGGATVPWIVWDENVSGMSRVFVSRLVGGATGQFQLANAGQPISPPTGSATRPDITFSGNTPYVTWRQDTGGGTTTGFTGHFVNAANPTFVSDESDVPLTPSSQADVRQPISSGCAANPFNGDGATCQGSAVGTPFFLFTTGTSPTPRSLLADAYQPGTPVTNAATAVTTAGGTLNGSIDPDGAAISVTFQFGSTTAYGQATAAQLIGPQQAVTPFTAAIAGLAPSTTIHYRAVATSDFGSFVGADEVMTTAAAPPPPPPPGSHPSPNGHSSTSKLKHKGNKVSLKVRCRGTATQHCTMVLRLSVTEKRKGGKTIAITARKKKITHRVVVIGSTRARLRGGKSRTLTVRLNRKGRALLAAHHTLPVTLTASQQLTRKKSRRVLKRTVVFHHVTHHTRHHG
jgi:hypothetical protein